MPARRCLWIESVFAWRYGVFQIFRKKFEFFKKTFVKPLDILIKIVDNLYRCP